MAIHRPGYGAYAALPGRNSTYFNNPYMGQIANNLSSAIYGNPADELTRERIKSAQADRERLAEQDAIAATLVQNNILIQDRYGQLLLERLNAGNLRPREAR